MVTFTLLVEIRDAPSAFKWSSSSTKEHVWNEAGNVQALSFGKLVNCITIGLKTHKMQSYLNVVHDNILIALRVLWLRSEWYTVGWTKSVCVFKCSLWLFVCSRVLCVMLKQHSLTYWSYSTPNSTMPRTPTIIVTLVHWRTWSTTFTPRNASLQSMRRLR